MAPITDFPKCEEPPVEVKVLVLNYDPVVKPDSGATLVQVAAYNDPRTLGDQYSQDIELTSGGFIKYKVIEWRDINEFPMKADGFRYTPENYVAARAAGKYREPDALDYSKVIESQNVVQLVDEGKIDEVWLFGGPGFGYFEAAMAGPGAFDVNGGPIPGIKSKRPFVIMGFNYERGVAEMIHNLAHRTESTMARIYGGWTAGDITSQWGKFAASERQSKGFAGVGNCHWPPNAEKEYDYANSRVVWSNADMWITYPKMKGKMKPINKENWGGPDYHRNYLKWWFARLPKAAKTSRDGRQNNWWKYVFEFNKYDASGKAIR